MLPATGRQDMQDAVVVLANAVAVVGESPLWSAAEQALYWIDGHRHTMLRLDWATRAVTTRRLPYKPGCMAFLPDGRFLVGYKKGLGVFDFAAGAATALALSGVDFDAVSFNDGACDAAGRLWIGTRHREANVPAGALYRIGPGLEVRRVVEGITVSNGIAFSPDGRVMYHTDSRPGMIDAYDYDLALGALSGRRRLLDYAGTGRRPDGCTVDAEGFLWVAEIDGGRVARYAPDGRLDRVIALPVSKPASVAFGGPDMTMLFITTISYGVDAAQQAAQPWAGMLLGVAVGVRGMVEPAFRGLAG
jgi:sugar lactone lactonase YvrE